MLEQVGVGAPGAIVDLAALLNGNTFTNSPATGEVFVYGDGDNQTFIGSSAADRIDGGAGTDDAIYEAGAVIGRDADQQLDSDGWRRDRYAPQCRKGGHREARPICSSTATVMAATAQ